MTPTYLQLYTRPSCYGGATFEDFYTVYNVTRDASALERSNWRILLAACGFTAERKSNGEIRTNAPNFDPREYDPQTDGAIPPIVVTRAGHAAVGWIDTLRIHKDAPSAILAALDAMIGKLEDYPILNEDDLSDLEYTEACEYWAQLSVSERVDYLQRADLCIFAARHDSLPEDPQGALFERLTR